MITHPKWSSCIAFVLLSTALIAQTPSITILTPTNTDSFEQNSEITLTWESNLASNNISVLISDDDGINWKTLYQETNDGNERFIISNKGGLKYSFERASNGTNGNAYGLNPSDKTRIKIHDSNTDSYAVSQRFTVKKPSIELLTPTGGERFLFSDYIDVSWATTGYTGNVEFSLSTNNGVSWEDFPNTWTNDGQERFLVQKENDGEISIYNEAGTLRCLGDLQPGGEMLLRIRATSGAIAAVTKETFAIEASTPSQNRFKAISTRNHVGTGENILISGFVITGNTQRQIIIRAVGPGLEKTIENYLKDPLLELYKLNPTTRTWALVATNDNWGGAASMSEKFASVGLGALDAASKDAALILTLGPGIYTAQVSGAQGTTGIGLIEVYED